MDGVQEDGVQSHVTVVRVSFLCHYFNLHSCQCKRRNSLPSLWYLLTLKESLADLPLLVALLCLVRQVPDDGLGQVVLHHHNLERVDASIMLKQSIP